MSNGQASALRWVALVILLAGGFMPPLDFFIVNVALSSIHESLGATPAELQLVISGYACGYGVFLITGGRLGDLYGRKRCFLIGMAGFSLASLGCGLATTPTHLVIARIVQGSAAAVLLPQVLGSIRALFQNERELARAMSAYGIMMGMAAAIGQFSGGALIQWNPAGLGWRAIFLLTLPVCAVTLVLGWKVVPETGGGSSVRLDLGGAALISLALAAIVVPLSEGREQGWPGWVFAVLASVPLLIGAFVLYEDRLSRAGGMPLVDLRLLRIPSFRRGVLVAALFFFTTSFYLLFGLYQQEGRGMAPLQVGFAIVPYGVGLFIGPLISAPLVALRPKLLAIGMGVQVTFYALIGLLVAIGNRRYPALGGGIPRRAGTRCRLPTAVRHRARRCAPGAGGSRRRHHQLSLADRRGGQRCGHRVTVLRCSWRPNRGAGVRPCLRDRAMDRDGRTVPRHVDRHSAAPAAPCVT